MQFFHGGPYRGPYFYCLISKKTEWQSHPVFSISTRSIDPGLPSCFSYRHSYHSSSQLVPTPSQLVPMPSQLVPSSFPCLPSSFPRLPNSFPRFAWERICDALRPKSGAIYTKNAQSPTTPPYPHNCAHSNISNALGRPHTRVSPDYSVCIQFSEASFLRL